MKKQYILLFVAGILISAILCFGSGKKTGYGGAADKDGGVEKGEVTEMGNQPENEAAAGEENKTEYEKAAGWEKEAEYEDMPDQIKERETGDEIKQSSGETRKTESDTIKNIPEISRVRAICELATLECYYHNVAKAVKEKGRGFAHIGEKERKFWIEYEGTVMLGIDASKVSMRREDKRIIITIPEAKVLGMTDYSFIEDRYVSSEDGLFNKNEITAQDQMKALAEADRQVRNMFSNDEMLLTGAQERAKELIENYIDQLNKATGADYRIEWEYEENCK